MALKIWLDDRLVDEDQAIVSVFDHGLLYGDGVFEGIRVYGGKIFEFAAHLKRLYESAKVIRLTIPMEQPQLMKATEANRCRKQYYRRLYPSGRYARQGQSRP